MSVAERREREKEERRNQILDAAQRVFYARGLDQATMEDVASEAQLGKGTLYLYFRNKDDLLTGIVARRQGMLLEAAAQAEASSHNGLEHVHALLVAYGRVLSTPREHLQMAVMRWVTATRIDPEARCAAVVSENMQRLFGGLCTALARGQADGSVREDREVGAMALQLWSGVNGVLLLQLQVECIPDPAILPYPPPPLEEAVDGLLDAVRLDATSAEAMASGDRLRAPAKLSKEA